MFLFQFRVTGAGACPSSCRHKVGTDPGQHVFPSQDGSHTYSLRLGQYRHANQPNIHISGMWKKTEIPRENPGRHEEKVQTPHSGPSQESFCSHQYYNKTMLNEMLLEDLLYITFNLIYPKYYNCKL